MKILTPEEEREHSKTTWEGGIMGIIGGAAVGSLGVWGATKRFPAFRQLSAPLRVFLVTSTATFSGVIVADRYSRAFETARHGDANYVNQSESVARQAEANKSASRRFKDWFSEHKYPVIYGSWAASMVTAFALVNRNKYLTGQQKLVQARVYAQGLTLAVLVASFALEGNEYRTGKGRWEKIKVVDPDDPSGKRMIEKEIHHESYEGEDQWMDMISSQESKMKKRGHDIRTRSKNKSKSQSEQEDSKSDESSNGGNSDSSKNGEKTGNGDSGENGEKTGKDDSKSQGKGQKQEAKSK